MSRLRTTVGLAVLDLALVAAAVGFVWAVLRILAAA